MLEPLAGSSGLIEFVSLDLGAVLTIRDPDRSRRELRIIAGNPVTMSKMTATVPDAGSYAPVTILVAERPEGVTLSYDRWPARSHRTETMRRRRSLGNSTRRC